jgi:hypothetical protein
MYYISDFLEITVFYVNVVCDGIFFLYCNSYKYYVSGHQSSCFISKLNISEVGFCLRLQVKRTQLGTIDGASPYLLFKMFLSVEYLVRYAQDAGGPRVILPLKAIAGDRNSCNRSVVCTFV